MSTPTSSKRGRDQESSFEDLPQSPSSSSSHQPTTKALRLTRAERAPLFCSLPPTCNPPHNEPTPLANVSELESHYAKYHAHVCEERGCAVVFPNARLLELHQTECHDPIAILRKERGEKIFACHLDSCTRKFLNPKKRRLHLIQAHGFPKEYFFAVTNKGVGGLLKRWGEGASMIRGAWKTRDGRSDVNDMDIEEVEDTEEEEEEDDSMDEEMLSNGTVKNNAVKISSAQARKATKGTTKANNAQQSILTSGSFKAAVAPSSGLDDLSRSMNSLSLVPSNIRFGRGGRTARTVGETKSGMKGGKRVHNPTHGAQTSAAPGEIISQMDHEDDTQLLDHDISINIDGALEALKSEAPLNNTGRSIVRVDDANTKHIPAPGRRARGGRGRGDYDVGIQTAEVVADLIGGTEERLFGYGRQV
ncbi:hypothetical protein ACEPAH_3844 [Sanghuangporus vaninii]